jgi:hypothetical protein
MQLREIKKSAVNTADAWFAAGRFGCIAAMEPRSASNVRGIRSRRERKAVR